MELNVWRKSSRSGSNGACVEIKDTGAHLLVRDSKDAAGPVLTFNRNEWRTFLNSVRTGELHIDN